MKSESCKFVMTLAIAGATLAVAVFVGTAAKTRAQAGGAGVNVNIDVPSQVPLLITDARPEYAPSGALQQITYRLTNDGAQALAGAEISWLFTFEGGGVIHTKQYVDYWWAEKGPLAVGKSGSLEIGAVTSQKPGGAPEPLESATGTVTYAEFKDGSKYGPDADTASAWFSSERTAMLAAYRELLKDYRSGGTAGLMKALQTFTPAQTHAESGTRRVLYKLYKSKGEAAVVAELTRVASMPAPSN